jgi:hypothetical protein
MDSIDPTTSTSMSLTADGTLVNNITGSPDPTNNNARPDLFLTVHTIDVNGLSAPLTWEKLVTTDFDAKKYPPVDGSFTLVDQVTPYNRLTTTLDADNAALYPGKLVLNVTDNNLANSPTFRLDSYWQILLRHLGQPGVI